jgi:hypothetical protein
MDFTWVCKVDGADIAELVLEGASVSYGRQSLDEQPQPPVAVLELLTKDKAPALVAKWPEFSLGDHSQISGYVDAYAANYAGPSARITLKAPVTVEAITASGYVDTYTDEYAGESLRRFTGTVQAIDYTYEYVTLTCLPDDEAWSRILVGELDDVTTWPEETDIARAARIATAAGITLQIDGTAGPTVIARPINSRAEWTLALLQQLAIDCDALLYTDRYGVTHYRTLNYAGVTRSEEIPPTITMLDPMRMSLELGLIRNQVTVEYGNADIDTGLRPLVQVSDAAQIIAYGLRDFTISTQLRDLADAQDHADRLLAALDPAWHMPSASVSFEHATAAQIGAIGNLEQGDEIILPELLPSSPTPDYTATVLGYTETLSGVDWQIEYHLSPFDAYA